MPNTVRIENIEEMRRQAGIDDVELRAEVGRLKIGDFVRLTFLTSIRSFGGETLLVRITHIHRRAFDGTLVDRPAAGMEGLKVGAPVAFTAAHIHSVIKKAATTEPRSRCRRVVARETPSPVD